MLCLSRREGESVFIGEDVKVTVQLIKGNQVRLGFTAPREIPIFREEIIEEMELEEDSA